jgi:AcrR family transcriptional regulator
MTGTSQAPTRQRPTGRRAGDSGTRDAILDAARDLFADNGYDQASIRAIATRAGVDPALIRHFFTDKETLFAATMADRTVIPQRLADALNGDPATLGRRITETYFQLWEDPTTRPILLGLVRSAMTTDHGTAMLIEALAGRVRADAPLPDLDSPRAQVIALAGSHLFGTAVARHVLQLPVLADMTLEHLVDHVTPAIQGYLDANG